MKVCVVGSTMADLVTRVSRLPRAGETLAGRSFIVGHGGKGGNQAVTAAKLGASVSLVSRVGTDQFGDAALANYRIHGVDVASVVRDANSPTGIASIFVDDAAENCIVIVPGANTALGVEDVHAARAAIEAADVVVCQLEVPVAAALAAFQLARAAGVRTIFNPAPAALVPDEIWQLTDIVAPNETEAALLTGLAVSDRPAAETAARTLLARGARAVIVTLGARGSLIVSADSVEFIAPISVSAVDSTGAGDAYVGTLAVCLAAGLSLVDAARRANLVAALSVTRSGTQTSFPDIGTATKFVASHGLNFLPGDAAPAADAAAPGGGP